MTQDKALEILDLDTSATAQEIRSGYLEMYNELQIRITNAPTDHQRRLYNRRLKELEEAFEVLGHNSSEDTGELPNIAPTEVESQQDQKQRNISGEAAQLEALKLLGLKKPFSEITLENAYRSKKRTYEEVLNTAPTREIEEGIKDILSQLEKAYAILRPRARGHGFAPDPSSKENSGQPLFWAAGAFLILAAIILLAWSPWQQAQSFEQKQNETHEQNIREEFIRLKSQGDALAETGNWEMALPKYEQAITIFNDTTVADSIQHIKTRLEHTKSKKEEEVIEEEKKKPVIRTPEKSQPVDTKTDKEQEIPREENIWEKTEQENTVFAYENYLEAYPQGKYATRAKAQLASIKAAKAEEEKEAEAEEEEEGEIGNVPFMVIEEVPIYPGCEGLSSNYERKACMAQKISEYVSGEFDTGLATQLGLSEGIYKIYAQFLIRKDGTVSVSSLRGPHPALEQEAERVVKKLPLMKPGKQSGKDVGVLYSLPIVFSVDGKD